MSEIRNEVGEMRDVILQAINISKEIKKHLYGQNTRSYFAELEKARKNRYVFSLEYLFV